MKKRIISLSVAIPALFLLSGFLLPARTSVSSTSKIQCSSRALARLLHDSSSWSKWWPAGSSPETASTPSTLYYHQFEFRPGSSLVNGVSIMVGPENPAIHSALYVVPLHLDSSVVEWRTELTAGNNPLLRWKQWWVSERFEKTTAELLRRLKDFAEVQKNIYDMTIRKSRVTDTLLIATRFLSDTLPSTASIYAAIHSLERYAARHNAGIVDPPMLHVMEKGKGFESMVALPLDKKLKGSGDIFFKQMVPGNILVSEIRGGPSLVEHCFRQLDNYVKDYGKTSPAIPFQSLVSDRELESDTSRWITRLYYPIMY